MAQFRVGQRVRIISGPWNGHEGTIVGIWGPRSGMGRECPDAPYPWDVAVDCGTTGPYRADELRPLLPPDEKADEFIARIKRLGSEPINDAPKVTVREGK